jgi:hypothetical protein
VGPLQLLTIATTLGVSELFLHRGPSVIDGDDLLRPKPQVGGKPPGFIFTMEPDTNDSGFDHAVGPQGTETQVYDLAWPQRVLRQKPSIVRSDDVDFAHQSGDKVLLNALKQLDEACATKSSVK